MKRIFSVIIILSMVFSLSDPAFAASGAWSGVINSIWSVPANWVPGPAPGTGDTATFNGAGNGNTTLDLLGGVTVNTIIFNTSSAAAYTIGLAPAGIQTLTLNDGGAITMNSTVVNNQLFNSSLVLGTDATTQAYTFTNSSTTNTLAFAGNITGGLGGLPGTETLIVTGAGNTSISGNISNGFGGDLVALTKSGTGTLALSGNNLYSGGTNINAGILDATSALALGIGPIVNNAALVIGTNNLLANGTYVQNAASSLGLNANSSSSFGSIISTGHVALVNAGSTVNVAVGGYIPNKAVLDIINTAGAGIVGGAPGTVNTSESGSSVYSPRVSFTSSILNGNLVLTANHATTGFASLANNANDRAAGAVLDNETNPSNDMANVLNTLEFLSNAQTTAALKTVGPIMDGGAMDNSTAALNNFIGASLDRIQEISDVTGVSSGDESRLNSLWAKQYGSYLDQGTRAGIQGYDAWNTGTALGLDHMFSDNLTIGASIGYAYGQVNSDANNASTDANSAQGTIYAGYQGTNIPVYVDLAGYFAENWYEGQRDISVGPIGRVAESDYDGQQSGAYLEGGYKLDLGNSLKITPLASLQWTHLSFGSYNETNANALDLNVNRQSYNILESGLGASIAYPVKYGWGNFTPEVHAKWLYDFMDDDMVVTSSYTGGGGSFTSTGAGPARDGVNIGGKLSFDFKNDISIIAGVDTELRDQFVGVSGTVTVRYKF